MLWCNVLRNSCWGKNRASRAVDVGMGVRGQGKLWQAKPTRAGMRGAAAGLVAIAKQDPYREPVGLAATLSRDRHGDRDRAGGRAPRLPALSDGRRLDGLSGLVPQSLGVSC